MNQFAYAVIKSTSATTGHLVGLYIAASGAVFALDGELTPPTLHSSTGLPSPDWWRQVATHRGELLEHENQMALQRIARASALVSNETLLAPEHSERTAEWLLLSDESKGNGHEPVLIFYDGDWRRDNAADEARVIKAYLLDKARQYL